MIPRQTVYFWLGILMFVPLIHVVQDRWEFTRVAQRATGTVARVETTTTSCSDDTDSPRRLWPRLWSSRWCTHYSADVRYVVGGRPYSTTLGAGRDRIYSGYEASVKYTVGERVAIVYDPRRPERAYADSLLQIWGVPIFVLFIQVALLVGALREAVADGG